MTDLAALDTPAALVDADRLEANLQRMQAQLDRLGVAFRPHVKTHKCLPVAERQRALGARGITVSTLKEAESFFDAGFDDITYAVGLSPDKIGRVLALQRRGCRLNVLVDSVDGARAIAAAAAPLSVLIEVDVDGLRAGVQPDSDDLIEVGRTLHAGGARLQGVLTHYGASYAQSTPEGLAAAAEQERALCVRAAQRLRAAGLPCPVVSVGSTPTALAAQALPGVTEVRAGVYVFFDLVIAGTGVCRVDDVALSVLTTVIGHRRDRGWAICDAGWMAMSRDRGTQAQARDCGYGLVCGLDGHPLPGLQLQQASQEHGVIETTDGAPPAAIVQRLPVGTRLRILPNHACATAAQHDRYHRLHGTQVDGTWPRFGGW
ncbi:MAG: alanine racemase [Rubrivivax sp.]